jgi:hypothetical protein
MEVNKACKMCHIDKSFENFHKDGRRKDGFRSICIDCEIRAMHPDNTKRCSKCGQTKEFNDFRKDRRLPDGLRTDCKICESDRKKKEYHINAEIHRIRKRQFHQDHKKERNSYNRNYYAYHTKALCDYQRHYRNANAEKLQIQRKARYIANPDIFKARANIRRIRLERLKEHFSAEQWQSLCAFYKYSCLCCGKHEPDIVLSPDHVIPIARGGSNSIRNIQPLCLACNKKKYVKCVDYRKDFDVFLSQLGIENP